MEPERLRTLNVSQTCYTRTQSVPVKICREISGHTFRVGVNGPECAQTTGAKVKEEEEEEKEEKKGG